MRILLIEDNKSFIEHEITELIENGHEITECVDGDEALDAIEMLSEFRIIILDIMLPRGSRLNLNGASETGVALYREIRRRRPTVPILILSAKLQTDFWHEIHQSDHHTSYLGKPFASSFKLLRYLDELLML